MRRVDEVSAPASLAEAMGFLKRKPACVPWAGGTGLMTQAEFWESSGSHAVMDLRGIPELGGVSRSSHYIEIGAAVSMSTVLALPRGIGLGMLRESCLSTGTAFVRNLATVGGNVCARHRFMSCMPALSCMDAAIEIRDHGGPRWSSVNRLVGDDGRPRFPAGAILTRIRIPVSSWSSWAVRSMGGARYPNPDAAAFAAAARFDAGAVAEIRLAAAGAFLIRDRSVEMSLIGRRLPLAARESSAAAAALSAKARDLGSGSTFVDQVESYARSFLERAPEESL